MTPPFPFNLDYTLKCGQIFGWKKIIGGFAGVIQNEPVYIEQSPHSGDLFFIGSESAEENAKHFFRFSDPVADIVKSWKNEAFLLEAAARFQGLRLIKQDPWRCTASFILSIVSNIPKIETTLGKLVRHHKNRFPSPQEIAEIPEQTLREFGMGFRARYLKAVARQIAGGFPLEAFAGRPYDEAKKTLMELDGIGEKVADCILLFGLGHLEAFPVDVWMKRILETFYFEMSESDLKDFLSNPRANEKQAFSKKTRQFKKRKKTEKYLSEWGRSRFGPYAGYAQQYLYTYGRLLLDRQSPFRESNEGVPDNRNGNG